MSDKRVSERRYMSDQQAEPHVRLPVSTRFPRRRLRTESVTRRTAVPGDRVQKWSVYCYVRILNLNFETRELTMYVASRTLLTISHSQPL